MLSVSRPSKISGIVSSLEATVLANWPVYDVIYPHIPKDYVSKDYKVEISRVFWLIAPFYNPPQ